ncbi:MAG: hypothetical protein JSW08_02145 [archaeon]|nr:MAG: hypothetical protein JSW08_02145 [archaeon]
MVSDENLKILMTSAVVRALDYKKDNPSFGEEEIMQHMMKHVSEHAKTKIPVLAAVSKAITLKEKYPQFNNKQIIEICMKELDNILANID